jgi:hypothetical protein
MHKSRYLIYSNLNSSRNQHRHISGIQPVRLSGYLVDLIHLHQAFQVGMGWTLEFRPFGYDLPIDSAEVHIGVLSEIANHWKNGG